MWSRVSATTTRHVIAMNALADTADLSSLHAQSARVRLQPLEARDSAALRAITDDATITGLIDFLPSPFSTADAKNLIRNRVNARDCFFGIHNTPGKQLMGIIGAHLLGSRLIEIGYWVGSGFRGHGYATEAVGLLASLLSRSFPDHVVLAECHPANTASMAVLQKSGFMPTGKAGNRPGRMRFVFAPPGP